MADRKAADRQTDRRTDRQTDRVCRRICSNSWIVCQIIRKPQKSKKQKSDNPQHARPISNNINFVRHFGIIPIFHVMEGTIVEKKRSRLSGKSFKHPKNFPGSHPPQYWPGPARLNSGGQRRSGAFDAVWLSAKIEKMHMFTWRCNNFTLTFSENNRLKCFS